MGLGRIGMPRLNTGRRGEGDRGGRDLGKGRRFADELACAYHEAKEQDQWDCISCGNP